MSSCRFAPGLGSRGTRGMHCVFPAITRCWSLNEEWIVCHKYWMLLPDGRLWWTRRLGEEFFREEGRSRLGHGWISNAAMLRFTAIYLFCKTYYMQTKYLCIYMRVGMDPSLPADMSMECSHKMRTWDNRSMHTIHNGPSFSGGPVSLQTKQATWFSTVFHSIQPPAPHHWIQETV